MTKQEEIREELRKLLQFAYDAKCGDEGVISFGDFWADQTMRRLHDRGVVLKVEDDTIEWVEWSGGKTPVYSGVGNLVATEPLI